MARHLVTDLEIDRFISNIIRDANHHAPEVTAAIMPLSTAVRKQLNLTLDKVEVYERNGELARTCWVTVGGRRYVFSYNYRTKMIDLRKSSLRGSVIQAFNNQTAQSIIDQQASSL